MGNGPAVRRGMSAFMLRLGWLWLVCMAVAEAAAAQQACSDDRVDIRGPFGTTSFTVDVADTPQERGQGLMWVTEMAPDAGMLFVYDAPSQVSFWMKNTLIPLDMIFTDARGVVRRVHANAIPGDLRPIRGGSSDILTVLEINGGLAAELGIEAGAQLRHPAYGRRAAWPC